MIKGLHNLDLSSYLRLDSSDFTHFNEYKLMGKCFTSKEVKQILFQRIVNIWNDLPITEVGSSTTNVFKCRLDKYFNYLYDLHLLSHTNNLQVILSELSVYLLIFTTNL